MTEDEMRKEAELSYSIAKHFDDRPYMDIAKFIASTVMTFATQSGKPQAFIDQTIAMVKFLSTPEKPKEQKTINGMIPITKEKAKEFWPE